MVGPLHIAGNFQHAFQREHHFRCRTQLRSHGRFAKAEQFIASPQSGGQTNGVSDGAHRLFRRLQIFGVFALLVIYH